MSITKKAAATRLGLELHDVDELLAAGTLVGHSRWDTISERTVEDLEHADEPVDTTDPRRLLADTVVDRMEASRDALQDALADGDYGNPHPLAALMRVAEEIESLPDDYERLVGYLLVNLSEPTPTVDDFLISWLQVIADGEETS